MSTTQQILDRVKIYRNSFTDSQIVSWMDSAQRQIFQDVPHEAAPYVFTTIADYAFYALPSDCDPLGIKQITVETKVGSEKFNELRFVSVESSHQVSDQDSFYSVQGNENIFLNPMPNATTAGKKVYVIYNKRPAQLSATSPGLQATPDLEEDFHELIELGAKARVARERGEIVDKNNFEADFNLLFAKYEKRYKVVWPEYPTAKDTMPRRRRGTVFTRRGRRYDYSLIPEDLR